MNMTMLGLLCASLIYTFHKTKQNTARYFIRGEKACWINFPKGSINNLT